MHKQVLGSVGLAVVIAACAAGTPTSGPSESVPPQPIAPAGWTMVVSFGGSAGPIFSGVGSIKLGGKAVALHAACTGIGTLVVLVEPGDGGDLGARPAAVFPCGGPGTEADNRVELTGMAIPDVATIRAMVVEGLGTIRHAAFNVSIEQPQT